MIWSFNPLTHGRFLTYRRTFSIFIIKRWSISKSFISGMTFFRSEPFFDKRYFPSPATFQSDLFCIDWFRRELLVEVSHFQINLYSELIYLPKWVIFKWSISKWRIFWSDLFFEVIEWELGNFWSQPFSNKIILRI